MEASRSVVLAVAALLAPRPLSAQDSFRTELAATFSYEAVRTDEPLVVVAGSPAAGFAYRADESTRGLALEAVRYLSPILDDGATPRALLPYVARASRMRATLGLSQSSRDSAGTAIGQLSTIASSLTGDRSLRSGSLGVEWYLVPAIAVSAAVGADSLHGTDGTTSTESPSEKLSVGSVASRSSSWSASLGTIVRLGDSELRVSGSYRDSSASRADAFLFTPETSLIDELRSEGRAAGVRAAFRTLLLRRRLALAMSGFYSAATSDVDQTEPAPRPLDAFRTLERGLAGTVSFYPSRDLGFDARLDYRTQSETSGRGARSPSLYTKTATVSLGACWFASPRASIVVRAGRSAGDELLPPGSATYQQLAVTSVAVDLSVRLRF